MLNQEISGMGSACQDRRRSSGDRARGAGAPGKRRAPASEFATTQATPVSATFNAFSLQFAWLEGSASSDGTCTSGVKHAYITGSRMAAGRPCTPVKIAPPAAIWPNPVAYAQNVCEGGSHAGTNGAVSRR